MFLARCQKTKTGETLKNPKTGEMPRSDTMSKVLTAYSVEDFNELNEDDKKFLVEEDGKVFYDPSPLLRTLENQRKAEREAKAEAERIKAQIEILKSENSKAVKPEEKNEDPQDSAQLL